MDWPLYKYILRLQKSRRYFSVILFERICGEEYQKLLNVRNKDVYDLLKITIFPILIEIATIYTLCKIKGDLPCRLLNIDQNKTNIEVAKDRINRYMYIFSVELSGLQKTFILIPYRLNNIVTYTD